ncbi:hypothetical protein CHELA40_11021 [Chelatococcus asaccharovorans]|nr:hypothetical protein CHELA40_11021 [Chelatococcus asaccharovorans]CAH1685577.1 hypothetical protein CHELA17_64576 [Chelatococcus asaccharovorans]
MLSERKGRPVDTCHILSMFKQYAARGPGESIRLKPSIRAWAIASIGLSSLKEYAILG